MTANPTKNFSSDSSSKEDKKHYSLIAMAITCLIAFLFAGYLYYDHKEIKQKNRLQSSKIDSLLLIKSSLDMEMLKVNEELTQYKGKNKNLELALASANSELSAKDAKIRRLISENANTKIIQKEVTELRSLKDTHLKRIQELEEQVNLLTARNKELTVQNSELLNRIGQLESKVSVLDKKVQIASVIKTENAIIIGEKKNKQGKYIPSKLKKAERLLITFDLDDNKVTDAGEKTFYIRVLNPSGKLIENSQSGVFTNGDKNVSLPYTTMHKVNYSNAKQKVLIPVDLNADDHPKGSYNVEFYCNGLLSGIKKLQVK